MYNVVAGQILFYSGVGPVDLLVRAATLSAFDHVAIALGHGRMVEALPGGVRISPVRWPVVVVNAGFTWNTDASEVVKKHMAEPYGWLDDLAAGLGSDAHIPGEIECAELASDIITALGMPTKANTPGGVFMALIDRECRIICAR